MSNIKKYGAFAGVFTPSLLTILGVIMYMRLGWVVGEAGLIYAIGIILMAHIISVTTGLSISSIATDKKIKTGGIYYILSRSLGLPMGGAIGIALFIGTALSISLYIVGFSESFLSLDIIREYTGLEQNITGLRIVGSAIAIILVVIAFISTSLALKMQFYILIAIALSLVSIAIGFFTHSEYHPETVNLFGSGSTDLSIVFAIFFPAVTGFTAGVAMSGDLKDPKKDIPRGTIFSILAGLIIYISLAIGMAYFIDPAYLLNDYNILTKIAWFAPLVIVGIWGATLSSALGGILGGPRIIQAISLDKIVPKFLGKGYGETNEPRNALLLIFLIAEGGVLIGKLDVIAGVVSMFYLASYGFINLAYVLEKWASTDFRPSFKIHISLGIIGFVASFAIMFKLDIPSMIASLLIMGGIYFIIKRRQVKTEYGDVWQSVWTSVMRRALQKMSEKQIEERNWKPNILLFSGGTKKRQYLLEFGKSIVGKHGILSNFDLVENEELDVLFSKHEQAVKNIDENIAGVFTRKQTCKNIYQGIEMITRTYGFSGVEPNTVLMGWGRHTKKPVEFVNLLKTINKLDYNILLMDYDKEKGFGNKKQIDIWIESSRNYGKLSLFLAKFLSSSIEWENPRIRVLLVNNDNASAPYIRKKTQSYLDEQRVDAEVIVINNEIEKKPFYEIIKVESFNSDIVMIGIPDIIDGEETEFVEQTSALCKDIGTVVLVKASSVFTNMMLETKKIASNEKSKISSFIKTIVDEKDISLPRNKDLETEIINLYQKYNDNYDNTINQFLTTTHNYSSKSIESIKELTYSSFDTIKTRYSKFDTVKQINLINQNQNNILLKFNKYLENYISEVIPELKELFKENVEKFVLENKNIIDSCPKKINISYTKEDLRIKKTDKFNEKSFKFRKKLLKSYSYRVKFKELVRTKAELQTYQNTFDLLSEFGMVDVQYIIELQKLIQEINQSFVYLSLVAKKNELNDNIIAEQESKIHNKIDEIKSFSDNIIKTLKQNFDSRIKQKINNISIRLNQVNCNRYVKELNHERKIKVLKKKINSIPAKWINNDAIFNNAISTEIRLLALNSKVKALLSDYSFKVENEINKIIINEFEQYNNYLENINNNIADTKDDYESQLNEQTFDALIVSLSLYQENLLNHLHKSVRNFPDKIEIIDKDVLNEFDKKQFEDFKPIKIYASRLLDYLFLNKLEEPLLDNFKLIKNKLDNSYEFLTDTRRLIEFSIDDLKTDNNTAENAEIIELIKNKTVKLSSELNYLKELVHGVSDITNSISSELSNQLIYEVFIKTASNLKHYIGKQEIKKKKLFIKTNYINIKKLYDDKIAQLIFAKSRALSLKQEINDNNKLLYSNINAILNIKQKLSPKQDVISVVPLYYRQLFTNKESYHKEFWVGRKTELESAENSINRFYSGNKGAMAIIGEHGTGKSFFLNYISNTFTDNNIYYINPPKEGSIIKSDFEKAIKNALPESIISKTNLIRHFEKNSVIILDDIELWWEKSENGNDLIEHIFEVINQYSNKYLFIVSMNSFVADLIFKLNNINNLFINIIDLKNVSSETLKEIILLRHKSGGLNLLFKQKELNRISQANLFNRYHKFSNGNISSALNLWLSNIVKYENETIFSDFENVNIFELQNLVTEDLIYLSQFVIHKNLTVNKLMRIMHSEKIEVINKLKYLLRSGFIEKHNMVYYLNKNMVSVTIKILKERGIL